MVRPLRVHVPGGFYHVTLRGNHRESIFRVDADRLLLNTIVQANFAKHGARAHAYCWMTNHIHLLAQVGEEPLAGLMRDIASGYARAFQAKRETTGHLFENRYHAVLVDGDSYLLELLRYIHQNPVRAKMVAQPGAHLWSSHHAYAGTRHEPWLTTDFALRMFSPERTRAIDAYLKFVNVNVDEVTSPLDGARTEPFPALGSDAFIAAVCESQQMKPRIAVSLDDLIVEACRSFGLTRSLLVSKLRKPIISEARAWIARRAAEERTANLTTVARELGCEPKTLREAMRRFRRTSS
jgi:putative transposase